MCFSNGSSESLEDKFSLFYGEANAIYILPSFFGGATLNFLDTINLLT